MLDGLHVMGPAASAYYLTVTCVGTYILMNLLIAVLLQLFAEDADGDGHADAFEAGRDRPRSVQIGGEGAEAAGAKAAAGASADDALDDADAPLDEKDDVALGCLLPSHPLRRSAQV